MNGKRNPVVVCGAILALVLAVPMRANEGGGATLEELIEKCKAAETMADMIPMIYPDDRPTLGSAATMIGAMVSMEHPRTVIVDGNEEEIGALAEKLTKQYEAIEQEHGLTPASELGDLGFEERQAAIFEGVDVQAFIADVEAWMFEVTGQSSGEAGMMPDFSLLGEIQEDGDTATADMGGQPMTFKRADGRWYVRLQM